MIRLSGGQAGSGRYLLSGFVAIVLLSIFTPAAMAAAPSPGGNITATNPGGGPTAITEDDAAPGAANIRISPTTLSDADMGETPDSIRLISVTGGTVAQGDGSAIVLGAAGTVLMLTAGDYDARFTPTPDRDTDATIQYVVVDEGGVTDSAQSTITVNITPADDPPAAGGNVTATNTSGGALNISEDAAAPGAANMRITPTTLTDPDTGETPDSIRLISVTGGTVAQGNGTAIVLGASGTILALTAGNYDARFTPTPNRDTDATIQYVVVDEGGVTDSAQSTITVNITPADDPPATGGNVTATNTGGGALNISEDAAAPGAANMRITPTTLTDPDTGETPDSIRLISVTGGTVAQGNGTAIVLGASGTILALTAGNYDARFTPTPNRDTDATIQYVVVDEGGVADSAQSTITVNITPADDPPSAGGNVAVTNTSGGAISILEDAAAPGAANVRITPTTLSDPDTAGGTPNSIRLLSFTGGTIAQSNGSAIVLGPAGTVLALSGGGVNLRFTPAADRDTNVVIPYVVVDPGGVADSASSNATVSITPGADAPSAGGNVTATAPGGGATTITEGDAAPGAANIRVTPTTLTDADNGETPNSIRLISVTGGTVTQSNGAAITLGASGTVLSLTAGNLDLRFTPAANRDTAASIVYVVVDPGGVADSASSTITVNIAPVPDAPSAGGNVVATAPGGGATNIQEDAAAPGAANIRVTPTTLADVDAGETPNAIRLLSFTGGTVTQSDNSAIVLGPAGTVLTLTSGRVDLRFTPAANRDTAVTIPYVVVDPGGVSDSASSNITVNITAVNDAPSGANATLADILEDNNNPAGATVTALFGGSFSDVDGTFAGIAIVGNPQMASEGVWQYSPPTSPGSQWFPVGNVTDTASAPNALVLGTTTLLRFVPAAQFEGAVTSLTVRVLDDTYGGGFSSRSGITETRVTLNTASNGGSTPISAASYTITHNVTGDNDTPTQVTNNTLSLNQGDAATIGSALLAYTDVDDVDATLVYTVVSGPTNGTLNLTPTFTQGNIDGNAVSYTHNGSSTSSDSFTFNVRDDDLATTADATFNITINRTPTVASPIADVSVNENAANTQFSVLGNFTDPEAGPLTFTVQSVTGGAIFSGTPSFAGSLLTIAYAANAPGIATITVRATDNGADFVDDTFTVSVNDAPVAANDPGINTLEGTAVIVDVLANDSDLTAAGTPGTLDPATVTVTGAPANGTTGVNTTNGRITYTPTGNFNGVNTFTYTVKDTNALPATSNTASVTVTVDPVNDAPVLTVPGATQNVAEGGTLTFSAANGNAITATDVDADETAPPAGGIRVTLAATKGTLTLASTDGLITFSGDNTANVTFDSTVSAAALALNGLIYTPNALVNGAETITIDVSDRGNTGSGGVLTQNDTIDVTINATNNPPIVTVPGAQTVSEDTTTGILGISVADPDAGGGNVTVTLSVAQGQLAVNTAAAGGVTAGNITGNNSASVALTGSLTQLNNTLPTLTFTTAQNLVTAQTLTVLANDNGNTGGPAQTDTETVAISITPQNDNPTFANFPGATQNVNEDTVRQFSTANGNRITLADVDVEENNPGGTIRAVLAVGSGTLTLSGTAGLTSVTGNGTAAVTLIGPLASVNTALNGLAYQGTLHFNGADTLTATINDLGNTGAGGASDVMMSVGINVLARNDAPAITVPGAQSVDENANLPFSATDGNAISIADVDADEAPGDLDVTLAVANGTLTLADTAGLTSSSGNMTGSITMAGSPAAVNAALDGLVYQANPNFNGNDSLDITVDDQGNTGAGATGTDSDSVAITVDAVNNPPQLAIPGPQTIDEDATAPISGISVADVDAGSGNLIVLLSVGAGRLQVNDAVPGGVPALAIGNNNTSAISLTGTVSQLNLTLPTLTFTSSLNNRTSQTLTVNVNDQGNSGQGGSQMVQGTVAINITALNDDPVIALPPAQAMNEGATLVFGTASANAITVSDVDAAEAPGPLRVTLSVAHGRLTLGATAGITLVTGTGANDTLVTFTGTSSAANSAMDGLTYQPDTDFNTEAGEPEAISLIVNDQGNTGQGGGGNITGSVAINIAGVNDDPVITVPGARVVNEDTDLLFNGSISVSDLDVSETPSGTLRVTLTVGQGDLTLATTAGITVEPPGPDTTGTTITFTGSQSAVNAAMDGLRYRGNQDFNGNDTLDVTVNDLGNTGQGGATDLSESIPITVTPVNDPPVATNVLLSPAEPLRNENLVASYTYTDVDGDTENGTTIRWFRDGALQSAFNNLLIIPMASTIEEEIWFFQVIPNDGQVAGTQVQSNSVSIRPVADLQMTLSRDPSQVVPGENVSYTFQVRNLGPSPVNGAAVTSVIPATLQDATWTCADCGTSGAGSINESVDLASGETVLYVLTALVDAAATGDLTVSASVAGPALVFEVNNADNTDTDTVPLMPEASLSVTMSADRASVQPGGTITYTVTATNNGPSVARGVLFGDTPDSNSMLATGTVIASRGTVTAGNGTGETVVGVNVGDLPLGGSVDISYAVTVISPFPADGLRTVCARGLFFGDTGNPDVNFVDAQPPADVCTTVESTIAISATKTDALLVDLNANGETNPGDTVRYTVQIVNTGDGGANNLVYTNPPIANGILIEDSIVSTPVTDDIDPAGGGFSLRLDRLEGGIGDASEAIVNFDVTIANPLPPGESLLVSQGEITYDELPAGDPVLTDDPDAVSIEGSDVVPVDVDGNVIHPAPTVTRVVAAPVLVVLKADDIARNEEKRPGDRIDYTVTIENRGNQGATDLVYRVPFRDGEISELELEQVDGADPLIDVATSLLTNFEALDTDGSAGLSSQELEGSFFALSQAQFNQIDTTDARLELLEDAITIGGTAAENAGSPFELVLNLGQLNGRNPLFTNGPTITITFAVELETVLGEGLSLIQCQGTLESGQITGVLSDDPETINVAGDPTQTAVRAIPELTVVPEILTIDFGDQDIDDGPTAPRMIELTNAVSATARLTFSFVGLEGASLREFVITSDSREAELSPGSTRFIEVAFDPDSIGNKRASLRVESDDPDDSAVDINLSGRALDSDIRVTPSTLDFGKRNLLAGPSSPQSVSIINDGLGVLTLDSVTLACGPDIFPVMTQARFDELDRNANGLLTQGIGTRRELELAVDLFDVAEFLMEEFSTLDTDASQDLSPGEVDARFPFLTVERFDALDADGSQNIAITELDSALQLAEFARTLLDSFEDFDTSAPEGLDFNEAQSILPDLTELEFLVLDGDSDGVLAVVELDERIRISLIATQLQTDFFGLDLDRDNQLSMVEIDTFVPLLTPGRFAVMDADANDEISEAELAIPDSVLAVDILARFGILDADGNGGLTIQEINATCAFEIFSDSSEETLETAQSRLVRIVFNPATEGAKVGTLRVEANQSGQGTPIVSKVSLFGIGNRTPRIVGQNPVTTLEDTPVTIILDNLLVDSPLLDFPDEVTLAFQPRPADANYTRDGDSIIPDRDFNGVLFVPVTVRDGNIDSNIWNLRIDVAKVNDPPTGISLNNGVILENQPLNSVIGLLGSADPDIGDLHLYSLVPDDPATDDDDFIDNEFFGIVANQLVSRAVFDFELRDSYTVLIRTRDPEGLTFQRAFNISIQDQPDDENNSVSSEVLLNNFDEADTDNDGILSFGETTGLLPGFTRDRFDTLNTEAEISLGEIERGVSFTGSAQALFDNFDVLDSTANGELALAEAQGNVPVITEEGFAYLDLDGSGMLSPSELQSGILLFNDLRNVRDSFNELDADSSGSLTVDELPAGLSALNRTLFDRLETNAGLSRRELESQVTCALVEGGVALIQPTGDLLAPPGASLLEVTFNAEAEVNIESACSAGDIQFTFDIGAESILITDLAEYFLQNFDSLDADFDGALAEAEVASSRIGLTPERFDILDFDADGGLATEELEAAVVLSDLAAALLEQFAALNADNSTGLSFAETFAAGIDLDQLRYDIIDLNRNGVLTRDELQAEADLPGYLLANFDTLDTGADAALSLTEVRATLPGLSQTRFDNLDTNRDGFATEDELAAADDFAKSVPVFAAPLPAEEAQKQLRGTEPATFSLPVNNAYRVRVTAMLPETGQTEQSEDFVFEIRNGVDDDNNGYLDFPFEELLNDGSRWMRVVPGANCSRRVLMHAWRGANIPGPAIEATLVNPADPSQQLTLRVPHGLAAEGEEAILIAAIACDAESLFTRQGAESIPAPPEDAVDGTAWISVSVIVRDAGAASFHPVGEDRLAQRPVTMSLNHLNFSPEDQATFYRHNVEVVSEDTSGLDVVPAESDWSFESVESPVSSGNTLTATLERLGAFIALESLKPPILVTVPALGTGVDLGEVRVNETTEVTVTVTNIGGERLIGVAELRDAAGVFTLIGEASYDLGHGESHEFLVRFSPNLESDFAATLAYSGDPEGLAVMDVRGTGMPAKGFGCGAAPATHGIPWGNTLVFLITLGGLLAGARTRRSSDFDS